MKSSVAKFGQQELLEYPQDYLQQKNGSQIPGSVVGVLGFEQHHGDVNCYS